MKVVLSWVFCEKKDVYYTIYLMCALSYPQYTS
jgi:hypothetical protein